MRPIKALSLALALALCLPALAEEPNPTQSTGAPAAADPDFDAKVHDYLLRNPDVLMEMLAILDARKQADAEKTDAELVKANAAALFDDGYSFVGGNPEGKFTVVEFLDYQCGFCRKAHPGLREMISADGDIRLIVKDFPILGPGSDLAARAATATMITQGSEAYGRLNEALMALREPVTDASLDHAIEKADLDPAVIRAAMADPATDAEITRRLARTQTLAQTLAITGTPTFVFDTRMVRGYVETASMKKIVEELRSVN